jgi:predicted Zn-dependent protease
VLLVLLVVAAGVRSAVRVRAWRSSETAMEALVASYPESGTGWMYVGRRLASQGRDEEALRAFGYAVVLLDSEYRPTTELAAHLIKMNRLGAARFFLRRAWRGHPEWSTAPGLLAAAELNAGRPERAAPAARSAIILRPENASMHHLLAQALAGLGDWPGAVAARRASLRTGFADRPRTWMLLAADLAALGDTTRALAALDSASLRQATPEDRDALAELRRTLGAEGGNRAPDIP